MNFPGTIKNLITGTLSHQEVDGQIDELLGLNPSEVEASLKNNLNYQKETYVGLNLNPLALYTPYRDYYNILEQLKPRPGELVVELGAGIGRLGLLSAMLYPEVKTHSIEVVSERITPAMKQVRKQNLKHTNFVVDDLNSAKIPEADYYFIYLSVGETLFNLIDKLKDIATRRNITVVAIESHGDLYNYLQLHSSWLPLSSSDLPSVAKRHDQNIHFYASIAPDKVVQQRGEEDLDQKQLLEHLKNHHFVSIEGHTMEDKWKILHWLRKTPGFELMIKESDHNWLGSPLNSSPSIDCQEVELTTPPRVVNLSKIVGLMSPQKRELKSLLQMRDKSLPIKELGVVRKIITAPNAEVEFSNGKRYSLEELEDIF